MTGKHFAVALATGFLALGTAGQANAELLSLKCNLYQDDAPNVARPWVFWIDLNQSLGVIGYDIIWTDNSHRTLWSPILQVTITAQNFVFHYQDAYRSTLTIDRLSGEGYQNGGQFKECTKTNDPYPADAPSLTQKF